MRLIKPGLPPDGERRPWLRGADSYLKKMIWRFEYLTLMSEIHMNFTFSCLFFIYIKVHIYFKSCWGLHFPYLYGALSPAHATDCLFWTCYPGWNLLRRNRRSKRQFWKPPSDSFVEARHSLHLNILLLRHSLGTRRGFSPISGRGINFFPENKSVNWAELGFHNLCFSHKFIHKKCFPEDQVHNKNSFDHGTEPTRYGKWISLMDLEIGFIKSVSSNLILYDVHRISGFLTPSPLSVHKIYTVCPQIYCISWPPLPPSLRTSYLEAPRSGYNVN